MDTETEIREARPEDAAALARAVLRTRAHMRPWEPYRTEHYYTAEGQAERLADGGRRWFAWAGGEIVANATLSGIVMGPLRGASLGYWVDPAHGGRGLATALVRVVTDAARDDMGLHRLAAGTLLDNHASQRVLAKSGFERIGTAPRYLHIDGAWRDHHLFQLILHDEDPPRA
ncbi:GNAT family N-acetyltransferase [Streptomyces termitum]|uniref:N-acetyltransferase domain-containing protein n=1 Tax=Streptomyces termitum TaxID=67368 RepID=A0A918SUA8_9ACTN|nr:GNAT family protein [Streptomyces termitum]GHA71156.1 hypothetical protein GCM10010305_12060 [Streptomyces termitum]